MVSGEKTCGAEKKDLKSPEWQPADVPERGAVHFGKGDCNIWNAELRSLNQGIVVSGTGSYHLTLNRKL